MSDKTPEKALAELWEQKMDELIDKHIKPMYASLEGQSISYFLKDGTISGSFGLLKDLEERISWIEKLLMK